MPLQVAFTQPDGSVFEHLLYEGRPYHIGRSGDADIIIDHPQVSRLHARLNAENDASWALNDTSSSGCFVQGAAVSNLTIKQSRTILLGPVACRFTPLQNLDVVRLDSKKVWQDKQLFRHTIQFQQCADTQALLALAQQCLQQSLGCERAAVVLVNKDNSHHQPLGFLPWMQEEGFTGSRTFINQCLAQREVLAIGSLAGDAQMASQHSVIRHQIKAALAVPLLVENSLIGVLYADSLEQRGYFSQTDVAFARKLANLLSLRLIYHNIEHEISQLANV